MSIEELLKEPFPLDDIEWRVQQSGISGQGNPWALILAYVDARAVMDRLDEVCGVNGWQDDYEQWTGGMICRLKCEIDGKWVQKTDGSPETAVEAFKGGLSKALVRTASKFGIGRYLYHLPTMFAICQFEKPTDKEGWNKAKTKDKSGKDVWFYWQAPLSIPSQFLPSKDK